MEELKGQLGKIHQVQEEGLQDTLEWSRESAEEGKAELPKRHRRGFGPARRELSPKERAARKKRRKQARRSRCKA